MRAQSLHNLLDRRRGGYTFVELMIVLLVLGLAATLVIPSLGQVGASRLPAAMRMLEADMAFAQAYAISHHESPCVVVFDPQNAGYHLALKKTPQTPLTHPGDNQPYRVRFGQGRAASLSGIRIKNLTVGDDNTLGFGGLGQLDQATSAHITLTDGQGSLTLRLDPVTGLSLVTNP